MNKTVVAITDRPIDPPTVRNATPVAHAAGGLVMFEGIVRDVNEGKQVRYLEYETFDTLALKELTRICVEACEQFGLNHASVTHRKGRLEIGDIAVMVAAVAGHRGEAFLGCRYIIDQLKVRAPIWKKEFYLDGTHSWPRCSHHHRSHYQDHHHDHIHE